MFVWICVHIDTPFCLYNIDLYRYILFVWICVHIDTHKCLYGYVYI